MKCGILGAQERDLGFLSDLHQHGEVEIVFVYDRDTNAVGLEIAEILGIDRLSEPGALEGVPRIDYVVVSEPRVKFSDELRLLEGTGARILTPAEALKLFAGRRDDEGPVITFEVDDSEPHSIEDTLVALEKLLDRRELLKFLLDVAVRATGGTAGSIMLSASDAQELYIAYATGLSERVIKNTRQKLGRGIAGRVALSKRAELIQRPARGSLYAQDRERADITSAICVPLLWEGKLLGVLNVSSDASGRVFDNQDFSKMKRLSRRLARVLFESTKLQEVQMRHREAKFRATMGQLADRGLPTQDKFSVLTRYLAEVMGAETVEIYLNTEEGDWFVLAGSNRLLTPRTQRIRYRRGALSRAFLQQTCIVLAEGSEGAPALTSSSSVVYCRLPLSEPGGVIVLEFSDRGRLDEFLLVKDPIVTELAWFLAAEWRERRLRREIHAASTISSSAAALLTCRVVEDLANVLSHVVADILECKRVSVRLRRADDEADMVVHHLVPPDERGEGWKEEDEKRFQRLVKDPEPYAMAYLDFESVVREKQPDYHSLLAYPLRSDKRLLGGIIAYDKHPRDPMEDAVFSTTDRTIMKNLTSLILPVLESLYQSRPIPTEEEPEAYDAVLEANRHRLLTLCDSEIARSERYHHGFSLILFRIEGLAREYDRDHTRALALADDIARGLQTRTRKTDFGTWIDRETYAMMSLDGWPRIRHLISRIMVYLDKDLSGPDLDIGSKDVRFGASAYPGTVQSGKEMLQEAEHNLRPVAPG